MLRIKIKRRYYIFNSGHRYAKKQAQLKNKSYVNVNQWCIDLSASERNCYEKELYLFAHILIFARFYFLDLVNQFISVNENGYVISMTPLYNAIENISSEH